MYKKIQNPDDELLFTHAHQHQLTKPNPVILNTMARAEMYVANTFVHVKKEAVYGLMLSTRQALLETRLLLHGQFSLQELTHGLVISHVIQASATRLILVHYRPIGELVLTHRPLLEACQLKNTLLEYSLLLDDFIIASQTKGAGKHVTTTSLARLGLV